MAPLRENDLWNFKESYDSLASRVRSNRFKAHLSPQAESIFVTTFGDDHYRGDHDGEC